MLFRSISLRSALTQDVKNRRARTFERIFCGGRPRSPVIEGPRTKRTASPFLAFLSKRPVRIRAQMPTQRVAFFISRKIGSSEFQERRDLLLRLVRNAVSCFPWPEMIFRAARRPAGRLPASVRLPSDSGPTSVRLPSDFHPTSVRLPSDFRARARVRSTEVVRK